MQTSLVCLELDIKHTRVGELYLFHDTLNIRLNYQESML